MKKINLLFMLIFMAVTSQIHGQYFLTVTEPANSAGQYPIARAAFGGKWTALTGSFALANNGAGSTLACDTIIVVSGKIAFIDRGDCAFVDKVIRAQNAGAIAVMICQNTTGDIFPFGPKISNVTIPVAMLHKASCDKIKINIASAKGTIAFSNPAPAATVLWSEDFSKRLAGWTTNGKPAAIDTFGWDSRGMSDGAFRGEVQSPTAENGAAIFDADFKTSKGDFNNVPAQGPYTNHYGELVSPVINCSTFSNIRLRFFQYFAPLNSGYSSGLSSSVVAFSYDGGVTWPDSTEVNAEVEPNDETARGSVINLDVPKFDLKPNCRIKFIFNGDFYVWIIDDVELITRSAVDLVMTDNFFMPFNYATPASQITTDTSTFSAEVTNLGTLAVGNAKMRVMITDPTGKIIHQDSAIVANVPGNRADSLFVNFPKIFVPGKLGQGIYKLIYSVDVPSGAVDGNKLDNRQEVTFLITEDLFSKHDANQNSRGLPVQTNYQVGNLYLTSTDWNTKDKFKATDVGFGVFINTPEKLIGKSVTLYLARFTDKVDRNFTNWDRSKSITNNKDQLELVGLATYDFKQESSERAVVTLQDFTTFTDGVELKKGSRYLLAASYADAANKIIHFLELDYFYDFGTFIYTDNQWFDFGFAPELSMRLALSTPNDEIALPEYSLQLMPNPATDFVRAQVNFDKVSDVNFVIADIQGRIIRIESKKKVIKESFDFDTRALAPGTYLMRISSDEGTRTKKFVVQR